MRIVIDEERCCSSGQCAMTAPDVFDQRDSDGVSVLIQPAPGPDLHTAVREAALICPTRAIALLEE